MVIQISLKTGNIIVYLVLNIRSRALLYSFSFSHTDAYNALTIQGIDPSTNLFTLKHGLYFVQGNVSTDNNWPYTGEFMGIIEKRGTENGTESNYHCTITCWNEYDGKEYNNLRAYGDWTGWRMTYTNKNKPTASDVNAPTIEEFNSLKTSVSEGKSLIATAVTGKGVQTAADATFQTMATNISSIPTGYTKVSEVNDRVTVGGGGDFRASLSSFKNGLISIRCTGRTPYGNPINGYIEIQLA